MVRKLKKGRLSFLTIKTGRNIQINIKGELETKNELYRIADLIDQPLGETLKRALAALQRELDQAEGSA
ncbi:Uncharacterised protein [Klebsiella pneumoniae]|uniref:Uncharacterized protein n=1 Tax=Klebsiella pneumoniae TaxID=573 RepID=A0A377ZIX4_KLEPN|nr:Uncharacterised protein [Klebsiella pneumoniae]STV66425.1 Uncharacterised protein [Klebsiella pneumoniae]STW25646.1 Uncharacterised protein [Klebsiella pneumoniae]